MAAISCCFVIPVLQALSRIFWLVLRSLFHQQHCCITHTHTALATSYNSNFPFSFDTHGISFIINNSATCIICNQSDLFVGRLSYEQVSMTTCEGYTVKQRYLGTMRLILIYDSNVDHSYDIPNCIYDPNSPVNIVGIPVLENYFNDASEGPGAVAEDDGSTILSSGCCSHFKWDHGKHSLHFNHPEIQIPELCLYQGTGYFQRFARD